MKAINAGVDILFPATQEDVHGMYKRIESAGRTCYKSEDKITDDSAKKFITGLIKRGHEAMIEHANMTVRFTVDRGVSHEIVRHRIASFAQESTRYCNYSQDKFGKEITVIKPAKEMLNNSQAAYEVWSEAMRNAEKSYMWLLNLGVTPQIARAVLPNSLKTELVMTANLREWRHFLNLRAAGTTGAPHPQMQEVAMQLLEKCNKLMPEVFGDIGQQ